MSLYMHHVPGRLRVRSRSFACRSTKARLLIDGLKALDGVGEVMVNERASSITIFYDPAVCSQGALLGILEQAGCIGAARAREDGGEEVSGLFGKALLGALAQTLAQRSIQTLVGGVLR